MAWSTLRTLYAVANQDLTAILGTGGAPTVAIQRSTGRAVRADAGDAGRLVYVTSDSGTTWRLASEAASSNVQANGTGVVATSETMVARQLKLTLTNTPVVLADEAGVVAYGALKIADMPAGAILILGAVLDLNLTKSSAGVNADWDGDIALGTAACGNNATLAGTEANIIASTVTPQAVAGATTGNAYSATAESGNVFDGTSSALDVYLNILVDDADHNVSGTPCNIICNGTVKLSYIRLGDY